MNKKNCIICAENSHYDLCKECYHKKNEIKDELEDIIWYLDATKNHYYEIKNKIFYINDIEYVKLNCLKLLALGEFIEDYFNQKGFIDKAKTEINDIITKKKKYLGIVEENNLNTNELDLSSKYNDLACTDVEEGEVDFRKKYPTPFRCKDGHYVRSKAERIIDDYLFTSKIIHVYEKRIINEDKDEQYFPDFYLPYEGKKDGDNQGIYIEYFGIEDDEKYNKTAHKKMKFYKTKKYDVVEIREMHINNLEDYLEQKIKKINRKYKK